MNSGTLDLSVGRAFNESGKWGGGVEWNLITQNHLIANLELRDLILQGCVEWYCFRQDSPEAAFHLAKKFATANYDPAMVKKVEKRIRQEHAGVRTTPIRHTSETKDEHG